MNRGNGTERLPHLPSGLMILASGFSNNITRWEVRYMIVMRMDIIFILSVPFLLNEVDGRMKRRDIDAKHVVGKHPEVKDVATLRDDIDRNPHTQHTVFLFASASRIFGKGPKMISASRFP